MMMSMMMMMMVEVEMVMYLPDLLLFAHLLFKTVTLSIVKFLDSEEPSYSSP